MRRLLGSVLSALLLAGALAGCGDDSGSATDDPAPTASGSPTKGSAGAGIDFDLAGIVSETAAGGTVDPAAVPLGDDAAVQEFTAQFETDAMVTKVQDAIDQVAVTDGMLLYGAVVGLGCDTPGNVTVTSGDQGLRITAVKVPSPQQECFAPVTTVALVLVAASAVS